MIVVSLLCIVILSMIGTVCAIRRDWELLGVCVIVVAAIMGYLRRGMFS